MDFIFCELQNLFFMKILLNKIGNAISFVKQKKINEIPIEHQ